MDQTERDLLDALKVRFQKYYPKSFYQLNPKDPTFEVDYRE